MSPTLPRTYGEAAAYVQKVRGVILAGLGRTWAEGDEQYVAADTRARLDLRATLKRGVDDMREEVERRVGELLHDLHDTEALLEGLGGAPPEEEGAAGITGLVPWAPAVKATAWRRMLAWFRLWWGP